MLAERGVGRGESSGHTFHLVHGQAGSAIAVQTDNGASLFARLTEALAPKSCWPDGGGTC